MNRTILLAFLCSVPAAATLAQDQLPAASAVPVTSSQPAPPDVASLKKPLPTEHEKLHQEMEKFPGTWRVVETKCNGVKAVWPGITLWFEIEAEHLLSETTQYDGVVQGVQITLSHMTLDVREAPYRFRQEPQRLPDSAQVAGAPRFGVYEFANPIDGPMQLIMNLSDDGDYPKSLDDTGEPKSQRIRMVLERIPDSSAVDAVEVENGPAEQTARAITHALRKKVNQPVRLEIDVESNSILVPRHHKITDEVRDLVKKYEAFAFSKPANNVAAADNEMRFDDPAETLPVGAATAFGGQIKSFALKHCEATSAAELLQQLMINKPFRAVADERTNCVIVTGTAAQMLAVEALLLKLDEAKLASGQKESDAAIKDYSPKETQHRVAELRNEYESANTHAHELAQSLRQTPDAAKKPELRTSVQRAFTLRQSLLRAELLEMQTRLLETQRSIDMRERIVDQIVDQRVEDLLNPQLDWEGSSTSETAGSTALSPAKITNSLPSPAAVLITELEGDWHLVANITKWGTERRPRNLTIRGDRWTGTIWDGTSVSSSLVVDSKARTIDFGTLKGKLPILKVNEQGTYEFSGDLLTIHSESTFVDSEIGTQAQQQTNIWKRGLAEIRDDDRRDPGNGMDFFYLNGNHEDTGQGKLIPGDKVDVIVSFASLNENPIRRVLAERLEVDGSSNSHRQISLLGTREQCLLLHNAPKHGKLSLAACNPEDDTLQYPDGINREAFKELETAAALSELKGK